MEGFVKASALLVEHEDEGIKPQRGAKASQFLGTKVRRFLAVCNPTNMVYFL
jgi:hypothetical protein